MKKFVLIFYLLLIFIPIFLPLLLEYSYVFEDMNLNPNDYARITDVEYKAVVVDEPNSNGKIIVTERLTFDIHAASKSNPFWELWRDLCEDWIDGVHVDYKVNSVKQILEDGSEIIYEESPKLYWDDYDYLESNTKYGPGKWYHSKGPYDEANADYECVFFYINGIYREKMVFEIEYEMNNAALRYNDCSDLYISLYSGSTIKHLNSFKAEILFPNKDMPDSGNYYVYTYGTNANEFPVTESATSNPGYYTFSFELDKDDLQFRPYNEYIEFDLVSFGKDRHIFTEHAPSNYYSYDDVLDEILEEQAEYAAAPRKSMITKCVILGMAIAASILVLIYALRVNIRMQLKHIFYTPTVDYEYFREIPSDLDPNFAATLVFCKNKTKKNNPGIYSAILLSLARKKYITLTETDYSDVLININRIPSAPQIAGQMNLSDIGLTYPAGMDTVTRITSSPASMNTIRDVSTYTSFESFGSIGFEEPIRMGFDDGTNSIPDYDATSANNPVSNYSTSNMNLTDYEPLTTCEQYYFDLLLRHSSGYAILMSEFQNKVSSDYEYTDSFVRKMEKSIVNIGVNEGYFQKADYAEPKKKILSSSKILLVFGILFVTLVNIISYHTRMDLAFGGFTIFGISCIIGSVYLKKRARKYVLLTQYGEDEYEKWHSLYNFLNSNTLINERTIVELPLWEKYLVYATAFGLSEKVIKAINLRCPDAVDSTILNNNYCRSGRIHRSGHSFHRSVSHGSSVARGGGGGFGYGGGGRGGGGGGGGH